MPWRWEGSTQASNRHDLAGELSDRPVTDDVASVRCLQDAVPADIDGHVMRSPGAGIAEEDEVAWLLGAPGDALAEPDLVAGVVGKPDAAAGGLVGSVENEAGAVEPTARGSVEVAAAPDVRLADLRGSGRDERAGEAGRKVRRDVAGGLCAVEVG